MNIPHMHRAHILLRRIGIVILLCALFFTSITPFLARAQTTTASSSACVTDKDGYCLEVPIPGFPEKISGPAQYIQLLVTLGLALAGIVTLILLIVAGATYVFSYANAAAIADAKDRIIKALVGLLLVLGMWIILNTINPDFLTLTEPDLTTPTPSGTLTWEEIVKLIRANKKEGDKCEYNEECKEEATCRIQNASERSRCWPKAQKCELCNDSRDCADYPNRICYRYNGTYNPDPGKYPYECGEGTGYYKCAVPIPVNTSRTVNEAPSQ